MRLINLKNLKNQKSLTKNKKKRRLLKTHWDFLEEHKKDLMASKAKYFQ